MLLDMIQEESIDNYGQINILFFIHSFEWNIWRNELYVSFLLLPTLKISGEKT